jgi:hypothetical protein
VSVAYIWSIFIVYAMYCEGVRGVDPGIGDSWRVQLQNGYELVMIDTQEQAFIVTPSGGQAHHDLTRIGATDRFIVAEDGGHFFLTDVRSRTETSLRTEAELKDALRRAGESAVELLPPGDFYNKHRWGPADAVATTAAFVPPGLVFLVFVWRLARFAFSGRVRTA